LSDFIDLMSPTQAAVFAALEAGVTLAPVHDHVKPGTEPNFVKIGAINGTNEGAQAKSNARNSRSRSTRSTAAPIAPS
jgi:hypothetical protein